ncbi:hypothetical protein EDD37DRAFT_613965 [Exophiala viscosa]|uniref:uncharacterized protein n=1 Tax=Exophiala viscosa TaxID=2486360 RepID=UPI00219A5587|nr:hypothetical protein EDD37DRAFT_613965 [Exophiala viscosa]
MSKLLVCCPRSPPRYESQSAAACDAIAKLNSRKPFCSRFTFIRHMWQALEEPPKSHEKRKTSVVVYLHLLQQKVMKTKAIEDADCYVSGLCHGISVLEECNLREEKLRELACAYSSNHSRTENIENLKLAIETLERCVETTGKKTYPQATISIRAALVHRYQHYERSNDVVHSVNLLRKGLEATPRDDPNYAPLRNTGLDSFVSAFGHLRLCAVWCQNA